MQILLQKALIDQVPVHHNHTLPNATVKHQDAIYLSPGKRWQAHFIWHTPHFFWL